MGLLDKLLGKRGLEDQYFDALAALGELAVRYPPRGLRLRNLSAVRKAQEALRNRQLELQLIEQSMEEEEAQAATLTEQENAERPELQALVDANRGSVINIEKNITALKKTLIARETNMKYFDRQLEAQEDKVEKLHETGEFEAEGAEREILKKVRLDHMRQTSELANIKEQIEAFLKGEGRGGEAMRAKLRIEEIERAQGRRDDDLKEALGALDAQAVAKEEEIARTEEALAEALAMVGEEIYAARIADPRYQQRFAEIDPIAQALAGKAR